MYACSVVRLERAVSQTRCLSNHSASWRHRGEPLERLSFSSSNNSSDTNATVPSSSLAVMLEKIPTDVWSSLQSFLCATGNLNTRVSNKYMRALLCARTESVLRRRLGTRTRSGRRSRRPRRFVATNATIDNKLRRSASSRESESSSGPS